MAGSLALSMSHPALSSAATTSQCLFSAAIYSGVAPPSRRTNSPLCSVGHPVLRPSTHRICNTDCPPPPNAPSPACSARAASLLSTPVPCHRSFHHPAPLPSWSAIICRFVHVAPSSSRNHLPVISSATHRRGGHHFLLCPCHTHPYQRLDLLGAPFLSFTSADHAGYRVH
jgi:hypothetical protein